MTNCKRVPLVIAVTLAAMFGTLLLMESLASIVLASPDDLFASDTGSGTACTQGSPCDLQTALGQATDGDTIYVAGGTYTDTTGAVVDVTKSITLYGGWDGTTTAPVVRDPDTYPTTLDGEGSRRAVRINGNYTVTLDGLELFNGSGGTDGGGLYVRNARVVVSGCQIYSNTAQYGGGVYLEYSDDAVLMGNQVFLNWSTTRGGGIYSGDSLTATLTGNDIYSNTCTSGSEAGGGVFVAYGHGTSLVENDIFHNTAPSGYGGGVHFYHSDNVVLTDNSFYGNEADDNGGGIYLNNSHTATLSYNDVFSNAASYGGGVHVQASDNVTLTENAIYSNTANQYYGGGVYLEDSDGVRLDGNDILSNTAVFRGGGVCLEDSDNVTLTSNTIVSNTAAWGGGVCLFPDTDSSSASLTHNDIQRNRATSQGGGVYVDDSGVTLSDNDVISNTAGSRGGGLYIQNSSNAMVTSNDIFTNTSNSDGGGVCLWGSTGATIQDNGFLSNTAGSGGGLYVSAGVGALVTGNDVERNVADSGGGIYLYDGSDGVLLTKNEVFGNVASNSSGGIHVQNSDNVTLTNNMVAGNDLSGTGGAGIYLAATTAHLLHTTVARNVGTGVGVFVDSGTSLWMTNTILVSHTLGIQVLSPATATLANTLWGTGAWKNEQDWSVAGTLVTGTLSTNWWEEPHFVDYGDGPYHLGVGSGAIDRGVSTWLSEDIDSDPRAVGPAPDLGADEAIPVLTVTKAGPPKVNSGAPFTYTLQVTNTGVVTAHSVVLTDALPAGAFHAWGGSESGGVVSWPAFDVPPNGGLVVRTFTVTATEAITNDDYRATAQGMSGTAGTVVVHTAINRQPVADAGAPQTVAPAAVVTLNGGASYDPDGDPLTYGWAQSGGTEVTLSNPAAANPTFTAPSTAGVLTFALTVTDTFGAADSAITSVTVEHYQVYLPLALRNH